MLLGGGESWIGSYRSLKDFSTMKTGKYLSEIISKLQSKEVDVIQLYSKILTPLLNNIQCDLKDKRYAYGRAC